MRILELCANYPGPKEKAALSYVKARNHNYRELGIDDIVVLNFSLPRGSYIEDGFKVISFKDYKDNYIDIKFDILISHAPNLRNHYFFLKKYQRKFNKVVFFFHGHEVLDIHKEYPQPYTYLGKRKLQRYVNWIYDPIKFKIWSHFFKRQQDNVTLIFVSKWIENKFQEYLKISLDTIRPHHFIIHNNISKRFEESRYDFRLPKEYDYITIRSNLDDPKYAVDVVNNLAKKNPQYRFLLIGRGDFFNHYPKASNIEQIERYLSPDEIVSLLNKSKCALMPTKNDTQGIMACEMATFGMPTITSNIDVCRIVFDEFPNVAYISNDDDNIDLKDVYSKIDKETPKVEKYFYKNTILKEVNLIKSLV